MAVADQPADIAGQPARVVRQRLAEAGLKGGDGRLVIVLPGQRDEFLVAMEKYRKHDYDAAAEKARALVSAAGKEPGQ